MTHISREQAQHASLEELFNFGRERALALAKAQYDPPTVEELHEAEEHSRCVSPAEEWIAGLNDRRDNDAAWQAYEDGFSSGAEDECIEESAILDWEDVKEQFDELLDEIYPPIKFGDLTYDPSHVLKAVDEAAYNEGMLDYADSLREDGYRIAG